MAAPIVFFDIAGPNDQTLVDFYASVFDWDIGSDNQFSVTPRSEIRGAIRKDPTEKRIYIGVPDVSDCLSRIVAAGGTIDAPRFEVQGVVVLGLFRDPAGNPMGLVELDGEHLRIP
ncbi:MAG: VOC family protein [Pseudomonadota bacterium]